MNRSPALILIGIVSFLWLFPSVASAQEKPKGVLTVSPAYLEVVLSKPGEEQDISITYTNTSERTITLEMFPLDFAHKDEYGTIGLIAPQPGSYSYGLASYLSLQSSQVVIEPRESHVFHVKIRNQEDLSPGGHYGAVVGRIIDSGDTKNGAQVAPSVSSLIFLNKTGGERYNLSLRDMNWGGVLFTYPTQAMLEFQNAGNIHLVPYGTLEVKDMLGRVTHTGILNTSSFMVMPQSRRYMNVRVRQVAFPLPITINTITVKGNDSLKKTTFLSQTTSLYIHPVVVLGSLVLMVLGITIKMRKKVVNNKDAQISHTKKSKKEK